MIKTIQFFLALCFPFFLFAQSNEIPDVTNKFLIRNATVTTQPGQSFDGYSILVEDGLITQVGANISAPYDAEIINADSMHVYPGFIAGLSHAGVAKAEPPKERPTVKNPDNPPNELAGITPYVSIRDVLKTTDKSISSLREQGFTISHSVPRGKMLPGMGSIIMLKDGNVDDLLMQENVSMFAQLNSASRMYPGTVMAVMSKFRDIYRKASHASTHEKTFKNNSSGIKRPNYDQEVKAFYPVVSGSLPVYFKAEKTRDLQRVLRLQKDLGFKLIPSEMKQSWMSQKSLKNNRLPLLLSLELPKEMKKDSTKISKMSDDEKQFLAKKEKAYNDYLSQSKMLQDAGMTFSYSLLGVKSKDILANLRKLVTNGLKEDIALASITTNPANNLGISNIAGSIKSGKLANLVVTNKSLFDKESKVRYVFVEGKKYEYEIKPKKKKKAGDGEASDLTGEYSYEIEIPGMPSAGTLKLVKEDEEYKVTVTNEADPSNPETIDGVEQDGNSMSFTFNVSAQGMDIKVDMDLEFDEDSLEGNVSVGDFGSFPVTGQKVNPK